MVGLSIVLEAQRNINKRTPQVLNKTTMIKPSSSPRPPPSPSSTRLNSPSPLPATNFLDVCFLCNQKLLPGKDIYMYKGDRGFCSVECRCRQIFMDEEESVRRGNNCSLAAATNPTSSSSSSSASRHRKGTRNRAGGFAY